MDKMISADMYRLNQYYQRRKIGKIAKIYSIEEEEKIYRAIAESLSLCYSDFLNKEKIMNLLHTKGNIVLMQFDNSKLLGLYERRTNDIIVANDIKKLDFTILHEALHKIGFNHESNSYVHLPEFYKEAGGELIVSECIGKSFGYSRVFEGGYVQVADTQRSDIIVTGLVKQMNTLLGNQELQKTVLNGDDTIQPKIKEVFGNKFFEDWTKKMSFIYIIENERDSTPNEEMKEIYEDKIKSSVSLLQDELIEEYFEKSLEKTKSFEEAESLLSSIIDFSKYRFAFKDNKIIEDKNISAIFSKFKEKVKEKYSKESSLEIPEIIIKKDDLVKISDFKREENSALVKEFEKKHKKVAFPTEVLQRFKKKKELAENGYRDSR